MRRGVIYKYTCLITNKIYIGQTICEYNRRHDFLTKERYSTGPTKKLNKFDAARKKYGIDNFSYEILEEFFSEDKHQLQNLLNEKEKYYIEKYNSFKKGYNSTKGGIDGHLSKQTKNSISKSLKGHKMSKLTRKKFTFKGHHHTEENKVKFSNRQKERFKDKSKHPMFGRLHSKESKEKNSKSRKGKCVGIDNPNSKRVKCFSKENIFIKEFICIHDAIIWLNETQGKNINPRQVGQISRCCSGKTKSAYGFIWTYY